MTIASPARSRLRWAGLALGFAFSGFFDGILLHQILQWHHLLSGVATGRFADLRVQVMADGIFHLLMYVVGAVGLTLAIRARHSLAEPGGARRLLVDFLVGFGSWHVIDAVFSHWLVGLHRIRMDVAEPIWWDIGWLVAFGLVPLAVAAILRRRGGDGSPGARSTALVAMAVLSGATLLAAAVSLLPVPGALPGTSVVVLQPGVTAGQWLGQVAQDDVRVLWSDAAGAVWIVQADVDVDRLSWYGRGAMYVSASGVPATCADWITPGQQGLQSL